MNEFLYFIPSFEENFPSEEESSSSDKLSEENTTTKRKPSDENTAGPDNEYDLPEDNGKYYTKHVTIQLREKPKNELSTRETFVPETTTGSESSSSPELFSIPTTMENTIPVFQDPSNRRTQKRPDQIRNKSRKKFTLQNGRLSCFPRRRLKTYIMDRKGNLRAVYHCENKKHSGKRRPIRIKVNHKTKKGNSELAATQIDGTKENDSAPMTGVTQAILEITGGNHEVSNEKLRGSIKLRNRDNLSEKTPNRRKKKKPKRRIPYFMISSKRRRRKGHKKGNKRGQPRPHRRKKKNRQRKPVRKFWKRRRPIKSSHRNRNKFRTNNQGGANSSSVDNFSSQILNTISAISAERYATSTKAPGNETEDRVVISNEQQLNTTNTKSRNNIENRRKIRSTASSKTTTPMSRMISTSTRSPVKTTTDFFTFVGSNFQAATTRPIVSIRDEPPYTVSADSMSFWSKMGLSMFYSSIAFVPWLFTFAAGRSLGKKRRKRSLNLEKNQETDLDDIIQWIVNAVNDNDN